MQQYSMVNSSIQHSNSQPFATCFPSHFIKKTAVPLRYKQNSSFPKNCISKIMYKQHVKGVAEMRYRNKILFENIKI
jgi:hypothetical protein